MQTDHVAFGVGHEGNVAVLADREFLFYDLSAAFGDAAGLDVAIVTNEIDENASNTRGTIFHLDEGAGRASATGVAGKRPHFRHLGIAARAVEPFQILAEHALVERLRALHVLDIDFEPTDGIHFHWLTPLRIRLLNRGGVMCRSSDRSF